MQWKSHFYQPLSQCVVLSQAVTPRVKAGHTLCDRAEADKAGVHSTHPHMQTTQTRAKRCHLTPVPPKDAGSPGPPVQGTDPPTDNKRRTHLLADPTPPCLNSALIPMLSPPSVMPLPSTAVLRPFLWVDNACAPRNLSSWPSRQHRTLTLTALQGESALCTVDLLWLANCPV